MSAPVQRRHLAEVVWLADHRPTQPLNVPAVGGGSTCRRDTLAVCWQRSQLRADLISRGTGLLIGAPLLALVLWVLSVLGWLPA